MQKTNPVRLNINMYDFFEEIHPESDLPLRKVVENYSDDIFELKFNLVVDGIKYFLSVDKISDKIKIISQDA